MKRFLSRLLAFGIILTIIGGILFAIAFSISGFNFRKMSSVTAVEHSFTESADEPINNIKIKLDTSDINVIFDENATEVSATYQTLNAKNDNVLTSIEVSVESGKLTIEETKEFKIHIFPYVSDAKATITIPSSREITLSTEVTTGDITVSGNATVKGLELKSSTGDIDMRGATIKSLSGISMETDTGWLSLGKFDTVSLSIKGNTGDVYIHDGVVTGETKIQLTTGDLTIVNSLISSKIETKASTGDVTFKGNLKASTLSIETSTGEIESDDGVVDAESIVIDTSTADVKMTLKGKLSDYTVLIDQSTGDSNISNSVGGSRTLNISVSTGDIEIDFNE